MFVGRNQALWRRLDELASKRRLSGLEADQLVHFYRQAATHLSVLRSAAPDPALVSQLSITLVKARARIGNPHDAAWRGVARFFVRTLPAALYRLRWWSVVVAAFCLGVAVVSGVWTAAHPATLDVLMPPAVQDEYVHHAFEEYYSEYPHASFTAQVWTNNAYIAAMSLASGITGVYPVRILFDNSLNIGATAALMHVHGAGQVFWSLILPHGLLELSCVFVAGAAGLRLFWAWLVPGGRTRANSLAHEGRSTIVVIAGMVIFLLLSGVIEGFVTPSGWPWWLKITVGALACAVLWGTTFGLGRHAATVGEAPDLTDEEKQSDVAVSV